MALEWEPDLLPKSEWGSHLLTIRLRRKVAELTKILFLVSNPSDISRLQLNKETREIDEEIRRSKQRDSFELVQKYAIRLEDLNRALLDVAPQFIHFTGRTGESREDSLKKSSSYVEDSLPAGIVLENQKGEPQLLQPEALGSIFELLSDPIQCVFLNGCYNETQADAILEYIPYVIGLDERVFENETNAFVRRFYEALRHGDDVEEAFEFAKNTLASLEKELAILRKQGEVAEKKPDKTYPERRIAEGDWDEIRTSMEREACVLVLGPKAIRDVAGYVSEDRLCQEIAYELGIEVPDIPDRFFYLAGRLMEKEGSRGRFHLEKMIKKVYRQDQVPEIYRFLAQIPFHLILTVSPTHQIQEAFDSMNIPYQFDFYHFKHVPKALPKPSKDQPLLYNLMGSIHGNDSQLISHEDVLEYNSAILSSKGLPDEVKDSLVKADNMLFVGFDFDNQEWDILLHLFETHQKETNHSVHSSLQLPRDRQEFLQTYFRINFSELNMNEFILEIHSRCEEDGLLRKSSPAQPFAQQIIELIEEAKIEDAIAQLEAYAEKQNNEELLNNVIRLSSRYTRLDRDRIKGTITEEEENIEKAKIINELLSLSDELPDSTEENLGEIPLPDVEKIQELKQIPLSNALTKNYQEKRLDERNLEQMLYSIEREECILVLGPHAMMDIEGNSLYDKWCQLITNELGVPVPESPDKLFHLGDKFVQQKGWRKRFQEITNEVYGQGSYHEMYNKLTKIPFHLILSVSPDDILSQEFIRQGLPYDFNYFNDKENREAEFDPRQERPLIYNFGGQFNELDSLVFTHEHLYDATIAAYDSKSYPDTIRQQIRSAQTAVFLGFDFENSYSRMLLSVLGLHKIEVLYSMDSHFHTIRPQTQEMYARDFHIEFLVYNSTEYIDEFYHFCLERNKLR